MKNKTPEKIEIIARRAGIPLHFLEPRGLYKAKVSLDLLKEKKDRAGSKYIVVSAITPSPFGEGKTVTTIGLSMALNAIKKNSIVCLRQPSMGPIFGAKGGGTGGGKSQVVPMEDINMHFTGDTHSVGAAHNLLAAFLDNAIFRKSINVDPNSITWKRVVDINDRALRNVTIRFDGKDGMHRESGFEITVASEIMAILSLSKDLKDMRQRLDRIIIGFDRSGRPVSAGDLKVSGAMAVVLRDAIKPNLVQTIEGTPAFVHTGPFANIAHGNSSIIADRMAFKLADFIVTESGFGADLGAEKFFDIKCRQAEFTPSAAILVCTARSLKMHSGRFKLIAGRPIDDNLLKEDLNSLEEGCANLKKQIENVRKFGIPVVISINKFAKDTEKEIELIRKKALDFGAYDAVVSTLWKNGSKGGIRLARAAVSASKEKSRFKVLYQNGASIKEKIDVVAKQMYGAKSVDYSDVANVKIELYQNLGYGRLPVCVAKTHLSLSADIEKKGAPKDFVLPVRDVQLAAGAGFVTPICGNITTMPSLPSNPIGFKIDIDKNGNVLGLF